MGRHVATKGRRAGTAAAMVAGLGLLASACGGGGGGGTGGALGDKTVKKLSVLQAGAGASLPVDAAPTPDGSTVYFTGTGFNGQGVFRMSTSGGDTVAVAVGAPFVHPTGIAIASDGSFAYVADSEAASSGGQGEIFSVALNGSSTPTPVAGTEGSRARGLEIVRQNGQDVIYYTGRGPDGVGGVFKIAASGGTSSTVAKGAPLTDPDAVTVAKNGTVYVTDRGPAGKKPNGGVYRVTGAGILRIADLRAPDFAGIALSLDESVVLVSALDPKHATDQVTLVDTTTLKTTVFNKTIKANKHGGGLHRAANANVFAWADVQRPGRNSAVPIYVFTS